LISKAYQFFVKAEKSLEKIYDKLKDKKDTEFNSDKLDDLKVKTYSDKSLKLLYEPFKKFSPKKYEDSIKKLEDIEKHIESMSKWDDNTDDNKINKDLNTFISLGTLFNSDIKDMLVDVPIPYKEVFIKDFEKYGSSKPIAKITLLSDIFNKKEDVKLNKEISKPSEYTAYLKDFLKSYKETNNKSKDLLKKVNEISNKIIKKIDKVDLDGDKLKRFKTTVTAFQSHLSCFDSVFARIVKLQNSHAYLLMGAGKKLVSALKNKD